MSPNLVRLDSLVSKLKNRFHRRKLYSKSAYWDVKAREYQDNAGSMWPNRHLNEIYHREHSALIDQELSEVKAKKVLDVGCGIGRISRHLAARGAIVQGIDFSPAAIEIARENTSGPNPSFHVCSVQEIDSQHEFDVVIVFGVLCVACRDRDELLRAFIRIRNALKPGGTLLLFEPIHRGFLRRVLKLGRREYLSTLEEAGFSLVSLRQMHFWPTMLLASPFHWPKRFTQAACFVDRVTMRLLRHRLGGDYTAIRARPN